jgi:undecaprenol kinase
MFSTIFTSIGHAIDGIKDLIKQEKNAKIHLLSTIIVIVVGIQLDFISLEWIWISLAIAGVWVAELINSALERLTDLVSPAEHPLAKKIKDYAAGAVLIMAIWAVFVFALIAIPHLLVWLTFSN